MTQLSAVRSQRSGGPEGDLLRDRSRRTPRPIAPTLLAALAAAAVLSSCARRTGPAADEHAGHAAAASPAAGAVAPASAPQSSQSSSLPAGATDAQARVAASPRHAEWVMVPAGNGDSVRTWVVYPQRRDRAPVVVVVHEIFGLSTWIRAVADQLAADGFIALAPDLLTGKNVPEKGGEPDPDSARAAIRTVNQADVQRRLDAVARYGTALPAALPRYGIVGFCWGGGVSFAHAVHSPALGASVVYYGVSPPSDQLAAVRAPVLGFYGENDARVNTTIPPADSALKAQGKTYEHHIMPGAGHGFLRAQTAQGGANLAATKEAWPLTIGWFRRYLGS
jgi:carboxymethylenebutenolidase